MMKRAKVLYLLAVVIFGFFPASAAYLPLRSDVQGDRPQVNLLQRDEKSIQFEVRLPGLQLLEGTLDGRRWDRLEIPGGGYEMELGAPEVPNFSRLLAIPARSGVRAELEVLESTTIPNVDLMPAQGDEPESITAQGQPVHFDMTAYSRNDFYPQQRVVISEPALMRGVRMVPVRLNPVQYNPATKELRVAHRLRVTVHFEGQDLRNVPTRQVPLSQNWANVLTSSLINAEDLELDASQMGSYLIICENDATLLGYLQPLVDWKTRKGHSVTVQTFSPGASNTTIKNMIQTAYNTWPVPPEYVLLFGDVEGSYALAGWSSSGAQIDHPYAQLNGSDVLADVALGRLPAENASEAQTLVSKVLFYERTPFTSNSEWYHQGVLVAGSNQSGLSSVQCNRYIKTRMVWNNYTRIDTLWYWMGGSVPGTLSSSINNGVTFANYRGWLDMEGFGNDDMDNLTNGRKLPFATILTCGTGGFNGESNMEHFVVVGTSTTPKGAVACTGLATWNTHTRFNNTLCDGIYAGIFDEGLTQPGHAVNRGKLEIYMAYQTNDPGSVSNFSNWNALAGDPGLELYTAAIHYLTANVPDNVTWGVNSLPLTVTETGVGPVSEATVCLYKSGELQVVGQTNASGQVELPLSVATTGNVKVTVTKHNFYPLVDSLNVVQQVVAVGYFSHTVDDDNTGGSSGDSDGIINPGEVVQIPTVFKNYGSTTTATSVSVAATESDPLATLANGTQTFPNLAPGATGNSSGSLLLTVAANTPNGHTVGLDLVTTAAQGTWDGLLNLNVISYDMSVRSAVASGGDTLLSPGETANLNLTVKNVGGKTANSLTATIVSLDTNVTVNDNSAAFGTVNVGATTSSSSNPFNLTAASSTPPGHWANLQVTFSANGAIQTDTITIKLGNKTQTDPQGPDAYGYYCFDNTDVNYNQAPVYSWEEIDPNYGGVGSALAINDPSEDQDASVVLTLPFTFRYYGQNVNAITVCSNGWIATHPDISFNDFRNYPIPSGMGPTGHMCAFWDDLITWTNGRVCAWSDLANHRVIIEWSRVKNRGGSQPQEIFEIILHDPVYYSTPTGDGEIIFQYQSITEVSGPSDDNPYSTVGIESPDHQTGVEVVYWNTYDDVAAAHLANGRAYKFTTALTVGGDPPIIGVNPTSLTVNAPLNGSGSNTLAISNTGGSILSYSTAFSSNQATWVIPGNPSGMDAAGGPDGFGYTWVDSDEPGGPTFNWKDISSSGTTITFPHNDSTSAALPIGFNFPYYGQMRTTYIVSANGWVSFTSHSNAYNNTTLPSASAPFNLMAPFWDDLDPLQSGAQVKTWTNSSDSLVVSYLAVPHYAGSVTGTYTFQLILTADGTITYQYQTLTGSYNSCTVGLQNENGNIGLQVAYNQTYLHNGLVVRFYHPFLSATPTSGAVSAGQSQTVTVTAFSYGLTQGTYPATMILSSNDPVTPVVSVPISVVVGSGPPSPVDITLTPVSPPIQIPASGGSFLFNILIVNTTTTPQTFDGWIMMQLPSGLWQGPMLGPVNLTMPASATISRQRTQTIAGSSPAGTYNYRGYVGVYSTGAKWDSSGFQFVKLSTGDGPYITDFTNFGESFEPYLTKTSSELPTAFALYGASPNPFNPETALRFALPQAAQVKLAVYDLQGKLIVTLVHERIEAGFHEVRFDGSKLASGVYFVHLQADQFTSTSKMLLLK